MTPAAESFPQPSPANRHAEDVAALLHFSSYIAKEAQRLGLTDAADKARLIEMELLRALADG